MVDYAYPTYTRDEIPAPREFIQIEYRGPNPLKVYHELNQIFRMLWEVKGTQINEPDFRWDTTSDPRPFFIQVFVERGVDKFTSYRVDLKMQGTQPTDPTKDGTLRIEIHGWIETKFDLDNRIVPINKFLLPIIYWPYNKLYYQAIRRRYIEWHRRRINRLAETIREILKIPAQPIA